MPGRKQQQAAEYIRDMAEQLAVLAREAELDDLAYCLDIAALEAHEIAAARQAAE